ncbi:MAG: acyltransferase family protein, partial [Acidimicrobiales bacterium]
MPVHGMTALDQPTRTADRGRIGYLPGLDGLRAVSVGAVIAYHLDLSWATGGYLGVEVFFVVSGYLITLLALDEERRTGVIDRIAFWSRRARRLLPAVIVLVAVVMAWTALVVGAEEVRRFRGDGLASLLYVQNWHAIVTDQPYFVNFGRPPPLRHLWSLAIEEQFYLLWPLFLPFALRRLGRARTVAITLVVGFASMLLMLSLADIAAPERAYYGTDTRAFGIMLGCALAFGWQPDRFRAEIGTAPRRTLGAVGLAAAAVLAWQFGGRSEFDPWTYPWGFALVDVCSALLIVTTTHPGSPLRSGAGSPLLAAIGRRSYSLYLWHWPVFVFTRPGVDWPLDGAAALVVRLALVFALAEASYRWIEQPFRAGWAQPRIGAFVRSARSTPRRAAAVGVATVLLLGLVGAVVSAPVPTQTVSVGTPVTIPAVVVATTVPPSTVSTATTATTAPSPLAPARPEPPAIVTPAPTTVPEVPTTTAPAPAPTPSTPTAPEPVP